MIEHLQKKKQSRIIKTIIPYCLLLYSASTAIQVESAPDFKDLRDGKSYKTVKIGNQVWMAENLNYENHNSYCLENALILCEEYGRFYKWRSAMSACPSGWKLPSREDWNNLKNAIGNTEMLYKWDEDNPKIGYQTSAPNFNALTIGIFDPYENHKDIGAYFWTSSKLEHDVNAICTSIDDLNPNVTLCEYSKYGAMPIRCIQDNDSKHNQKTYLPNVIMGKYIDSRDNREYKTVQINQQVWLAENLNYETPNSICHNNKPSECETYGRLYKWEDAEKACPTGWHLPSRYEIMRLLWAVGEDDGEKLKSQSGWTNNNNGWDDFGFNVLPLGNADFSESEVRFEPNGEGTSFWTSTNDGKNYYKWHFFSASWYSRIFESRGNLAEAIRCIKDYDYDVLAMGVLKDERDKKVYKTVTIGDQIWMAENLDYNVTGSQCYDNKTTKCKNSDRLYTWEQAKEACPFGWHLPSKKEWEILGNYIDLNGNILKSKEQWPTKKGTDEIGFNALPIGSMKINKKNKGNAAYFWTSDEENNNKTYAMELLDHINFMSFGRHDILESLSIRCIANTNNKE